MITEDIKKPWSGFLNIIRRLQQVGCSQNGLAIVNITVIVNSEGEPIHWLNPDIKLIEPLHRTEEEDIQRLVKTFGDDLFRTLVNQ